MKNAVLIILVVLVTLFAIYQYDPTLFGLFGSHEGFDNVTNADGASPNANAHGNLNAGELAANGRATLNLNQNATGVNHGASLMNSNATANPYTSETPLRSNNSEGFVDTEEPEEFEDGPANFGSAQAPAGCYPRDQLTPSELLPKDMNSIWAEQNPMGPGSLKGKNFLSAGALIGVNTVGQSLRNANLQIRSEPPNPQASVSIFNQSTISPDISHRPLDIGA